MGVGEDLAECLGVEVDAFDPSAFVAILTGFLELPAKLISPPDLIDLLPDLNNPVKLIISPVAAQIPKPLGDLDLGLDVFGPEGLVGFVEGLGNVALGIPGLFGLPALELKDGELDIEGLALELAKPPVITPPDFDALVRLITVSIGINPNAVPPGFPESFSVCLARIVAQPLGL